MISHFVVVITTHEETLLILFIKNYIITPVSHEWLKEFIYISSGFEFGTYNGFDFWKALKTTFNFNISVKIKKLWNEKELLEL
jgi:hypothetical protein